MYIESLIRLGIIWQIGEIDYVITFEDRLIQIYLPDITENKMAESVKQLKQVSGRGYILYMSLDSQPAQLANIQNATN